MREDNGFCRGVYDRLLHRFGHQSWWPAATPFEMMVGAILTQNTAWGNVERALTQLQATGGFSPEGLSALPTDQLEQLIRPSGTFRVKARRLKAFLSYLLERFNGSVDRMRREAPQAVRRDLLDVPGVGPETADCILLYALGHPFFVIDAYTRRIFSRLAWCRGDETYLELQARFHRCLGEDPDLFNDYHAQIVTLGKHFCRTRPRCGECPLHDLCPVGMSSALQPGPAGQARTFQTP